MSDFGYALQCDPSLLDARFERGALLEAVGDYERALEDYEATATQAPNMPHVHVARGRVHAARGELEEAVSDFAQALNLDGGLAEAHVGRGGALFELGDFAAAYSDFDRAVAIEPEDVGALQGRALAAINIGATLAGSNEFDAAQAQFVARLRTATRCLHPDDGNAFAHWHRGLELRGLDGHDWATDAFERAIAFMPATETAIIVRGPRRLRGSARLWGETVGRKDKLEQAVAEFAAVAEWADVDDVVWTLSSRAAALASLGMARGCASALRRSSTAGSRISMGADRPRKALLRQRTARGSRRGPRNGSPIAPILARPISLGRTSHSLLFSRNSASGAAPPSRTMWRSGIPPIRPATLSVAPSRRPSNGDRSGTSRGRLSSRPVS